jgi:dual specificity phosphatase 12
MKTREMCRSTAIKFIKQRESRSAHIFLFFFTRLATGRREVHPNYGFVKQLDVFADCHYDPSPSHVAYTKWKRHQRQNVTQFLNSMFDTTEIVHNQLLLSRFVSFPALATFLTVSCSDFPSDPSQAEALLLDLDITHLLSLSPARISVSAAAAALPSPSTTHHHINLPERQDALLTALPDACEFLRKATERGGRVLVHCLIESRACIVVCAYRTSSTYVLSHEHLYLPVQTVMSSRKILPSVAYKILEQGG